MDLTDLLTISNKLDTRITMIERADHISLGPLAHYQVMTITGIEDIGFGIASSGSSTPAAKFKLSLSDFPNAPFVEMQYYAYTGANEAFRINIKNTSGSTIANAFTIDRIGNVSFGPSKNLFWDNANGRLGIGTVSPNVLLDVAGESYLGRSSTNGDKLLYNSLNAIQARRNATGTFVTENLILEPSGGNVGIGTAAPSALLDLSSNTQLLSRLRLSGQEYYQAGNTSTDGVDIRLEVNRTNNRQIAFADSAAAINATNAMFRIICGGTSVTIGSISTDGTAVLPLMLSASLVGIGMTPSYALDVTGVIRASSYITLQGHGYICSGVTGVIANNATATIPMPTAGGLLYVYGTAAYQKGICMSWTDGGSLNVTSIAVTNIVFTGSNPSNVLVQNTSGGNTTFYWVWMGIG
jgi:hypothetical protein